ncbi:apoptotic protease-activating factor 1-like [Ptychodera flava]|uniref:apoptotic protease-activating factor 1-like n=1 Tax=Ptychodera flava TaxID=63121 RepID=UPI00396A869D
MESPLKCSMEMCLFLVDKLTVNECQFFAQHMGVSHVDINDVIHENPHNAKEQKYQLLFRSVEKKTVHQINSGLLNLERGEIVKEFSDILERVHQHDLFGEEQSRHDDFSITAHCHGMDFLTSEFVDRPKEINEVVELTKDAGQSPIGIIGSKGCPTSTCDETYIRKPNPVGIQGFGGWGKTTLAKAVAQKMCKNFKMEVVWLTVSQTPDILRLFNTMHLYLTGRRENFPDEKAGQEWLREFSKTHHILLILDDVWNERDVIPFNVLGPNCRLLITTRIERVLTFNNTSMYELGCLNNTQSKQMLLNYAGIGKDDVLKLELGDLIDEFLDCLKNFPLAIAVVGSVLRRIGKTRATSRKWRRILNDLQTRNKFWQEKIHTCQTESYSYSVYGAFDISFNFLGAVKSFDNSERGLQRKFLDFALFPEDTAIPEDIVINMWMTDDNVDESDNDLRAQFEEDLETLKESSLISFTEGENGEAHWKVHDLVLQYACYKFDEIFGEGALSERHRVLLGRYKQTSLSSNSDYNNSPSRGTVSESNDTFRWWTIDNDGYIYKFLIHHMLSGGMDSNVCQLLLNYRWLRKKLEETDIASVLSDFDLFTKNQKSTRAKMSEGVYLLSETLHFIARVVSKDIRQFPCQLIASLIGVANDEIEQLVRQIEEELEFCAEPLLIPSSTCLTQPGGYLKRAIVDNKAPVLSVAFTHDNKRIIAGLGTGEYKNARVVVIDIETGRERGVGQEIDHHKGLVFGLAVHPRDRFVITASFDMTLKMWPLDIRAESGVTTLKGHNNNVYCVALTKDGTVAVSGSKDRTIKKWDLETGECTLTMTGHKSIVRHVCITNRGDRIVSGGEGGNVRIWCFKTGQHLFRVDSKMRSVYQLSITEDDSIVFAVGSCNNAKVISLKTGDFVREIKINACEIISCCLSKNGHHLFTGSADGSVHMEPIAEGQVSQVLRGHTERIRYISVSSDGSMVASASEDCSIKIWDCNLINKGTAPNPGGHSTAVSVLAVTDCGKMALSSSYDHTLQLWDLTHYQSIHTFHGHEDRVNCVAISQRLCYGISGSADKTIRVWDLTKRERVGAPLEGHQFSVTSLDATIIKGRNMLLSGSLDNLLILWDLDRHVPLCHLISRFYGVHHIFTTLGYGKQVEITASFHQSASKWKINIDDISEIVGNATEIPAFTDCHCIVPEHVHKPPVVERYDTNGFIVGWDEISRIRFWHLDNQIESKISSGHDDNDLVTSLFLTADDALLLCGSESGNINIIGLQKTESLMGRLLKPKSLKSAVTAVFMLETEASTNGQQEVLFFAGFANGTLSYWKTNDRKTIYKCGRTPFLKPNAMTTPF